jgi:hypothetical protein
MQTQPRMVGRIQRRKGSELHFLFGEASRRWAENCRIWVLGKEGE